MSYIARTGGQIKYGHSEVGNFTLEGTVYEQNEIEFLPVDAEDAADQLMLAKWVIRNLAFREGYDVTFAPKITTGKAAQDSTYTCVWLMPRAITTCSTLSARFQMKHARPSPV